MMGKTYHKQTNRSRRKMQKLQYKYELSVYPIRGSLYLREVEMVFKYMLI